MDRHDPHGVPARLRGRRPILRTVAALSEVVHEGRRVGRLDLFVLGSVAGDLEHVAPRSETGGSRAEECKVVVEGGARRVNELVQRKCALPRTQLVDGPVRDPDGRFVVLRQVGGTREPLAHRAYCRPQRFAPGAQTQ